MKKQLTTQELKEEKIRFDGLVEAYENAQFEMYEKDEV